MKTTRVHNKPSQGSFDFYCMGKKIMNYIEYYIVFNKIMKVIQFWNDSKVILNNGRIFSIWTNFPFKSQVVLMA